MTEVHMQERLGERLRELRAEFESGQRMLSDLRQQQATLESTLLRISGAIQVLEELAGPGDGRKEDGAAAPLHANGASSGGRRPARGRGAAPQTA